MLSRERARKGALRDETPNQREEEYFQTFSNSSFVSPIICVSPMASYKQGIQIQRIGVFSNIFIAMGCSCDTQLESQSSTNERKLAGSSQKTKLDNGLQVQETCPHTFTSTNPVYTFQPKTTLSSQMTLNHQWDESRTKVEEQGRTYPDR